MFKKILIAEDFDTMNLGLVPILEQITSAQIDHVKYCDDAFLKIKRALFDKAPYDLLISDLSFEKDHRETKLSSGKELIEAVKKEQPDINVIVYSVENRPYTIKSLFEDSNINAYVSKGRDGSVQLSKAVTTVAQDEGARYISPELAHILTDKSILEIDEYDIQLIKHLSEGLG